MNPLTLAIFMMALTVTASNILVQFLLGTYLTWGALTYPVAFLVTDLVNRYHGADAARKVVLFGFLTGILCSAIGTQIEGEFGPLVTLRVALGSATGFLCAQLADVAVFDRLRHRNWWIPPLISTLIGASLDTILFFSIAFSGTLDIFGPAESAASDWAREASPLLGFGPVLPLWISLAVADWSVKLVLALLSLGPFRLILDRLGASRI